MNGTVLDYNTFCDKFGFSPPFTSYYGLIHCINKNWKPFLEPPLYMPYYPSHIKLIRKNNKGSRDFYDIFVQDFHLKPISEIKWERDLQFNYRNIDKWWESVNSIIHKGLSDCKLKWLQYRIIHRIIGTNDLLCKMGLHADGLCSFCNRSPETIIHLFYYCPYSERLWNDIHNWLQFSIGLDVDFSLSNVIFGITGTKFNHINIFICLVKSYIYAC